jgi:hypothetical protein
MATKRKNSHQRTKEVQGTQDSTHPPFTALVAKGFSLFGLARDGSVWEFTHNASGPGWTELGRLEDDAEYDYV